MNFDEEQADRIDYLKSLSELLEEPLTPGAIEKLLVGLIDEAIKVRTILQQIGDPWSPIDGGTF